MYEYKATVVRVVDGDTVDVRADLGFHITQEMRLRLAGINAPEMRDPRGKDAKAALAARLPAGTEILIRTERDRREKYGRYLAVILLDNEDINAWMVASGFATPYT